MANRAYFVYSIYLKEASLNSNLQRESTLPLITAREKTVNRAVMAQPLKQ